MIKKKRKFRKFSLDTVQDVEDYNALINSKLCQILEREKVVETIKIYDDGKLSRTEDEMFFLVHWDEQII